MKIPPEYQAIWERVFCDYIADSRRSDKTRVDDITPWQRVISASVFADSIVKQLAAHAKESKS